MSTAKKVRDAILEVIKPVVIGEDISKEIPSKWVIHGDCALLPSQAFTTERFWDQHRQAYEEVKRVLGVRKVARHSGPIQDPFRRPKIVLLVSDDVDDGEDYCIVTKKENGILFKWNLMRCMFSPGNISEKQRIASFDCRGQVVVDLYAGIGYFTLNYLVKAQAEYLYACEWNPEAVKWLQANLELNKVPPTKYQILEGDNTLTCPKGVADHVNLGLIPSSEGSWTVACAAVKSDTGGTLHIHGNVDLVQKETVDAELPSEEGTPKTWIQWSDAVIIRMSDIFKQLYPTKEWNVEKIELLRVKSYGPNVDHLVLDLHCKPKKATCNIPSSL